MIQDLLGRGYRFTALDDPGPDTVTITFDDGYYNNVLFTELSESYGIPYVIFLAAYYNLAGVGFPWFVNQGEYYSQVQAFDLYKYYRELQDSPSLADTSSINRPITFPELEALGNSDLVEIGCHGFYHQPLSPAYENYLHQEQELALTCIDEQIGQRPRYYSLPNGIYSRRVVRDLLKTFERVFTTEGLPFQPKDQVIHRITLINPNIKGPLIEQIDRHLIAIRRMRRTFRTFRRLRL